MKKEVEAVVQGIKDLCEYHVVFNDGDLRKVKRSQLRVKGARHFDENEVSAAKEIRSYFRRIT